MAPFPDTTFSQASRATTAREEGLDPLFLRRQSLHEDLQRWVALEARLRLGEQASVAAAGLRNGQATILNLVAVEGGRMNVKDLLARLRLSKQNLHNNMEGLLRNDYIRKAGCDKHDRRVRVLALTEKGLAFCEGLRESRARLLQRAYRSANALQVEGFRRTLLLLSEEEKHDSSD